MNKVLKMANDLIEIVKFSGQPVSIHFFRKKEYKHTRIKTRKTKSSTTTKTTS